MIYNLEDGRKALRDVFALQLFDNVQVRLRAVVSRPCLSISRMPVWLARAHEGCVSHHTQGL